MQDAGSFPSFLVRALRRYSLPLSMCSASKRVSKGSTIAFLQSLRLENHVIVAFLNASVTRNSTGSCRACFSCNLLCTSLSPNLQGHTEKLEGRLLSIGFASCLPKRDLPCKLVMGWEGEHPSGLALGSKLISGTNSSTISRFSCPRSCPSASPLGEPQCNGHPAAYDDPWCAQRHCCSHPRSAAHS